jgi:hypothetical protein
MDDRKLQDKQNQKLNPNERNQSEQKRAPSQDRERMDAKKDANQNQPNRNPQPKH